jgi:hypothetical protein
MKSLESLLTSSVRETSTGNQAYLDNIPVEIIGEIMTCISDERWRPTRNGWTILPKYTTKDDSRRLRLLESYDLGALALTSKRYYTIYKDREYAIMRRIIDQQTPKGPGMCDLFIRMAALVFGNLLSLPIDTIYCRPSQNHFNRLAPSLVMGRLNELSKTDVRLLLTPKLLREIFRNCRFLCCYRFPSFQEMFGSFMATIVPGDIPEIYRADICKLLSHMELLNRQTLRGPEAKETDSPGIHRLEQAALFTQEFRELFEETEEGHQFRLDCQVEWDCLARRHLYRVKYVKAEHCKRLPTS